MTTALQVLIFLSALSMQVSPTPAAVAPAADDYIRWLPGDTETIIVAKGPFLVGDAADVLGALTSTTSGTGRWGSHCRLSAPRPTGTWRAERF